jgi:hypothetical protein
MFGAINFLAVTAAAVATFLIGALWYSPILFAKLWMKAHGYTSEQLKEMQKTATPAYITSFVCYLVMGVVFSVIMSYVYPEASSATKGLQLGFLIWLGFAATIGLTANMFSQKPLSTYLIDVSYQLVFLLVMGAILGGWR